MTNPIERVSEEIIDYVRDSIRIACSSGARDCDYECGSCDDLHRESSNCANKILAIDGLEVVDEGAALPSVFDINEDVISAVEYKKRLEGWKRVITKGE